MYTDCTPIHAYILWTTLCTPTEPGAKVIFELLNFSLIFKPLHSLPSSPPSLRSIYNYFTGFQTSLIPFPDLGGGLWVFLSQHAKCVGNKTPPSPANPDPYWNIDCIGRTKKKTDLIESPSCNDSSKPPTVNSHTYASVLGDKRDKCTPKDWGFS